MRTNSKDEEVLGDRCADNASKSRKRRSARRPKSGQTELRARSQSLEPVACCSTTPAATSTIPAWRTQSSALEDLLLPVTLIVLLSLLLFGSTYESKGQVDRLLGAATRASDHGVRLLTRGVDPKDRDFFACFVEAPAFGQIDDRKQPYRVNCHPSVRRDLDGLARYPSGRELDAIYVAIDTLRDDEVFTGVGDGIMHIAHLIQVQKMLSDTRGRTSFFTLGGFVVSEDLVSRVVETPDSPIAISQLAGTLVHEYAHTRQYGADYGPVVQSFHQIATGLLYIISLPSEWSGIGLRDQHGQGHGLFEIGPWRLGIEAEQRLLPQLQRADWDNRVEHPIPDAVNRVFGLAANS